MRSLARQEALCRPYKAVIIPPYCAEVNGFGKIRAMSRQDEIDAAKAEMDAIRRELGAVGLLSHGYVQDRGPGAGGPCYQCTRKVKAKTVSVALSKEQFAAMKDAISNWKDLKARLARMEELSRLIIFATTPDTRRSKRPTKATLGLGKRPKSP